MLSTPPVWMSKVSPRSFIDIAEHSMCHPGRPGPISVCQNGSSSLGAFQTAKSRGLSFSYSSESMRACPTPAAVSRRESRP